jgi:hypothetical protein
MPSTPLCSSRCAKEKARIAAGFVLLTVSFRQS